MKCLKEPLSRMANRQDKTRGAFFEARFKSVAVVDEEALLRICVYIDLNPVAAKVAQTPETSALYVDQAAGGPCQGRRQDCRVVGCREREASPVRKRRPVWKSLFGSVRSKTVAGWIRAAKA